MAKAVHTMIRVLDEDRAVAFYRDALGLDRIDIHRLDGFSLIYMSNAETGFEVELTVNHGRTEPYQLGDGYGHLAVVVDDLEAEHRKMTDLGYAPRDIKDFLKNGQKFARFFFIADPDGYQIEVIQKGGRFA